jgi:hypothetical protein
MSQQDKTAFGEEQEVSSEINKKIKLSNEKSKFAKSQKPSTDFNSLVNEKVTEKNSRNVKAFELGKKFLTILSDKTLPENKGPINKNVESQICLDLFNLAQEINNDPAEQESAGSAMLDTLFFKSLLILRDKFNKLEYQLTNESSNNKTQDNIAK